MNKKLIQTSVVVGVLFVVLTAVLGLMYIFDIITLADLKDNVTKAGAAVLVLALAAFAVSVILSMNNKSPS